MKVRLARPEDAPAVVETITAAFFHDPLWSWAFPDESRRAGQYRRWWALFVRSGIANGWTWVTGGCEAVALWVPPGADELRPEDAAQERPLLDELLGDWAPTVDAMLRRFEAAHPETELHYYLSFLATHPDHRGQGLGVGVLRENLEMIDAQHMPAYLESSNPVNVPRYERLGFVSVGEFFARDDGGPSVTQMWRPAR
jgi:GNAT superfamily N-acetyltransferase